MAITQDKHSAGTTNRHPKPKNIMAPFREPGHASVRFGEASKHKEASKLHDQKVRFFKCMMQMQNMPDKVMMISSLSMIVSVQLMDCRTSRPASHQLVLSSKAAEWSAVAANLAEAVRRPT